MRDRSPLAPLALRAADLVDRLVETASDAWLQSALADHAAALRAEPAAAAGNDRAVRLATTIGLSPFEYDVLLLAGLPEEHEAVAHLARTLHPHAEPYLTMGALVAALGLDAGGRRHLRRALDAGPLLRHRLVVGPDAIVLPERSVRLPVGLWSVLRGVDHWPVVLRRLRLPHAAPPAQPIVSRVAAALSADDRTVVVVAGCGDQTDVAAVAAASIAGAGRVAVPIDASTLDNEPAGAWTPFLVARDDVPLVVGRTTAAPLPDHPGPVVVAVADTTGLTLDDRPAVTIDLPKPDLGVAVDMWARLVPEINGAGTHLAGLLRVGELAAARAVGDARATAASLGDSPLSIASVVEHVSRRTDVDLPQTVRLVRPDARWDELVLTSEQRRLLRSVADRVRGQAQVLQEWGFARPARAKGGARVLLSGPPGTGKTLAAEVLAADLGLGLLVVDLSTLVSKWLGETEKNIGEVFDAAERCQAVLFFDEADAIFGKRADSSDTQARWANLETAYLLTRIDRFDGVVVLATNLRRNIDDAFLRRLDVVVELDEPEREAREELWRRHLPGGAPLAADVDLAALAAMYEVTGGIIRNAVLAAAFASVAAGRPIDQGAFISALQDEYRKAGRSFPGVPRPTAAQATRRQTTWQTT